MFHEPSAVFPLGREELDPLRLDVPSRAGATPPRVVGGKYVLGARLGGGAMGTVYAATETETGDSVAIKVLEGMTPTSLWQFKREFRELADVVDPNVVRLRELICDAGRLYLAMERIRGRELDAHLRRFRHDDRRELRRALAQLADGVAAIHVAGKLHLDLKPSNVLVEDDGRVVVLDFGLATDRRSACEWIPAGTPEYMAPEQAIGRAIGPWTDCYALGVILYEALAGRLPFEEDDYVALVKAKRRGGPRPPSSFVADVPADLERLCLRLLEPDVERRADLDELRACLRAPGSNPTRRTRQPPLELVGRNPELRRLRDAFDEARGGRATAVAVEGRAGIGKTALARRFLDDVRRLESAVVLEARCHPRDALPFRMLDTLVDALVGALLAEREVEVEALLPPGIEALAQLFPVLDRVPAIARGRIDRSSTDLGGSAMIALRELVERLSRCRTVVLFVDDLQWSDVESAWLVRELLETVRGSVMFLGCYRSEDVAICPALTELDRPAPDGLMQRIALGELAPEDARVLVAGRLPVDADRTHVDAIVAEAGGHPTLLTALATGAHAATGASLASVFAARVEGLSVAARALLDIVVAAPTSVALARVRSSLSGDGASIAFVELCSAQLTRQLGYGDTARIELYHPAVRLAVVGPRMLAAAARVQAHRVGGMAPAHQLPIAARTASVGRRRERGEAALHAATQAERVLAFERAAALYGLALRNLATTPRRARDLQSRRAGALAAAGQPASAAGQYLRAAGRVHEAGARASRRLAADQLFRCGHSEEGLAVLRSVMYDADLHLAESDADARRRWLFNRVMLRLGGLRPRRRTRRSDAASTGRLDAYWTAATGLGDADPLRGCELGSGHLVAALRGGDPRHVARGAAYYASRLACFRPMSAMVDDLLRLAERTATEVDSAALRGVVATMSGIVEFERGNLVQASRALDAAALCFSSPGEGQWEHMLNHRYRVLALAQRGELGECMRVLDDGGRSDCDAPTLSTDVLLRVALGHWPHLLDGAPRPAGAAVDAAVARLPQYGAPDARAWASLARIQIALFERKFGVASRIIRKAQTRPWAGPGADRPSLRIWLAYADATCAVATDQFRRAERMAQALRGASPIADALAGLVGAQLRVRQGEVEGVGRALHAAAAALDASGLRLHAMAARYRAAQLRGGPSGDTERAQLRAALVGEGAREPVQLLSIFVPGVCEGTGGGRA